MVRAEAPSELCQEPGTEALVLGPGEALSGQGLVKVGEFGVEGLRVKNNVSGETREFPIKGFFVAIGHTPNTDIFKPYIDMDDQGYIITKPGTSYTNMEGVFCSGDAQDKIYRQAVTAAGSGCMAALDAERWLSAKHAAAQS